MMILRAKKEDIKGILNLLKQVNLIHHKGRPDIFKIGTKYSETELEKIINDDENPIYVAKENEKIFGYVFCEFKHIDNVILQKRSELYIDDLCVDETERGRHVGKQLFEFVKKVAIDNNCNAITLNVWELNSTAKAFYEAMGMSPLKTTMEMKI